MKVTPPFPRSGSTPFPNALLDEAMPRLKDSEWRLLCVIARQTLGWQYGSAGQRKERDWLTRSQLMARTGRHSEAISAALDALVQKGYITVQDHAGRCLTTPEDRRRHRGRTYYSLHHYSLRDRKIKHEMLPACSIHRPGTRKSEHAGGGKANRTKETLTKEKQTKEAFPKKQTRTSLHPLTKHAMPTSQTTTTAPSPSSASSPGERDALHNREEFKAFLVLFAKVARDCGRWYELEAQDDYARLSPSEAGKLSALLRENSALDATLRLQRFFASDLEFIRRRHYSLAAFIHSYRLLEYSPRSR